MIITSLWKQPHEFHLILSIKIVEVGVSWTFCRLEKLFCQMGREWCTSLWTLERNAKGLCGLVWAWLLKSPTPSQVKRSTLNSDLSLASKNTERCTLAITTAVSRFSRHRLRTLGWASREHEAIFIQFSLNIARKCSKWLMIKIILSNSFVFNLQLRKAWC